MKELATTIRSHLLKLIKSVLKTMDYDFAEDQQSKSVIRKMSKELSLLKPWPNVISGN